ncbi:MAG: hypothetical protein PHQ35_09410 [Phycisphaerae bacterium]|nr:hypothetical protein [Phycisphaerae bacterium]MDD5239934.1 hypothetical protein [Candidatus Nanoarchaeia archaeon]
MIVLINGKDVNDTLEQFKDDHVRLEIKSHSREHIHVIVGTVRVENEHMDIPYNPLTDMDCGTDAMINKEVK